MKCPICGLNNSSINKYCNWCESYMPVDGKAEGSDLGIIILIIFLLLLLFFVSIYTGFDPFVNCVLSNLSITDCWYS